LMAGMYVSWLLLHILCLKLRIVKSHISEIWLLRA
jgi:hypothetical protein